MDLKTYLPELLTEAILLDPLEAPWDAIALLPERIERQFAVLGGNYDLNGGIAIHRTAKVESGVVLKAPVIIGPHCFIAAHSYLRGGVLLLESARIGPGGEVKQSIIGPRTALAHFNFVGDSILGADVNMEAGAVIANHWNERTEREISVVHGGRIVATGKTKFGAVVGDHTRIGANAVLSPGTLLPPCSVVGRLTLVDQVARS